MTSQEIRTLTDQYIMHTYGRFPVAIDHGEDVTVQHHAALIAYLTKRPVKVKLTRAESILIHPKRHPMEMVFSLGCDENGRIQGVAAEVIADTGAYASLGGPVLERACTHAAGPYNYQNFEIDGWAYYTNNPPAGAFRGFGVTQTCFCIESLLNQMADLVGISPWEIRECSSKWLIKLRARRVISGLPGPCRFNP